MTSLKGFNLSDPASNHLEISQQATHELVTHQVTLAFGRLHGEEEPIIPSIYYPMEFSGNNKFIGWRDATCRKTTAKIGATVMITHCSDVEGR